VPPYQEPLEKQGRTVDRFKRAIWREKSYSNSPWHALSRRRHAGRNHTSQRQSADVLQAAQQEAEGGAGSAWQESRLQQTNQIRPDYAEAFRCIASACEDICCGGWKVVVDQPGYEKLQALPPSPLRTLIDASIQVTPKDVDSNGTGPPIFARIVMNESNQCPMLSAERLCRVHSEYGEATLAYVCATYPRIVHSIGTTKEKALALSCPEAARLVLLNPRLLEPRSHRVEEDGSPADAPWLPPFFWPVREVVLALILNRHYPLWQRLFLLGVLCRQLDAIASKELNRPVQEFLDDFDTTVKTIELSASMEAMPVDPIDLSTQLDTVGRLAGLMLRRSYLTPRYIECLNEFTSGIGNAPGATLESLAARYTLAHDRFFAPFFDRHPHILENFLINTILRCHFPYGRDGMKESGAVSMAREFALLTAQYALMKGLLIGVAGFHREHFSTEHVVHTVQAATKHFDHHPEFLNLACELLVERGLNTPRGLTILVRNAVSHAVEDRPSSPSPEVPAQRMPVETPA
jgi:lysine-N-methylase